jgi:hypothetical protein
VREEVFVFVIYGSMSRLFGRAEPVEEDRCVYCQCESPTRPTDSLQTQFSASPLKAFVNFDSVKAADAGPFPSFYRRKLPPQHSDILTSKHDKIARRSSPSAPKQEHHLADT